MGYSPLHGRPVPMEARSVEAGEMPLPPTVRSKHDP